MDMRPSFETAPNVRILINIGAGLDIPTGEYIYGKYGESILNGGLGAISSVVAIGNNFKTTLTDYMTLSAASRLSTTSDTSINTFDTESSKHEGHAKAQSQRFDEFKNRDILQEGFWNITDQTMYAANKWFDKTKEFCTAKVANAAKLEKETPFLNRDCKTLLKVLPITFAEIDSFTEFTTDDVFKMQDENELGASGRNTMFMRAGLSKTTFLAELPTVVNKSYHFTLMTAQIGKDIVMASGPIPVPPNKKLQHLKNGDKLKGVTDKFTFLMSNCWHSYNAAPLLNQSTKSPEYPRNSDDTIVGDLDLNIISLRQLRSKSGPTGYVLTLIVSQIEGVLPSLTEFHYIKESERYGLNGSLHNYSLDLLPDLKLSRTTVRGKIDSDPLLRRALNITSEMCQMLQFWRTMDEELMCTPKVLYDDLIKLGYDWNVLLNTRGWWCLDNDKHPIPFLSTKDLLNMRIGKYKPYWLEDDKKTIKKDFIKNCIKK